MGQSVGAIVASSYREARAAAALVAISYDAETPIISIADAKEKGSFLDYAHHVDKLNVGDVEAAFAAAKNVTEGCVRQNGQHAFYMEKQGPLCLSAPAPLCCPVHATPVCPHSGLCPPGRA